MPPAAPVLKKQYCFPLRRGLLASGYFKLINTLFLIYILITMIIFIVKGWKIFIGDIMSLIIVIVLAADDIGNIIFIFGACKKILKLLYVSYFYSIFFLVLTSLSVILYSTALMYARWDHISISFMFLLASHIIVLLGCLLIQAYVLLLLRRHINKINDSTTSNAINAVEPESSIVKDTHEEKVVSTEYELKDMRESNKITASNEDDDIV